MQRAPASGTFTKNVARSCFSYFCQKCRALPLTVLFLKMQHAPALATFVKIISCSHSCYICQKCSALPLLKKVARSRTTATRSKLLDSSDCLNYMHTITCIQAIVFIQFKQSWWNNNFKKRAQSEDLNVLYGSCFSSSTFLRAFTHYFYGSKIHPRTSS